MAIISAALRLCIIPNFKFGTHFALESNASKATLSFLVDWSREIAGGLLWLRRPEN